MPPSPLIPATAASKSALACAGVGTSNSWLAAGPMISVSAIATRTSVAVIPLALPGADWHPPLLAPLAAAVVAPLLAVAALPPVLPEEVVPPDDAVPLGAEDASFVAAEPEPSTAPGCRSQSATHSLALL